MNRLNIIILSAFFCIKSFAQPGETGPIGAPGVVPMDIGLNKIIFHPEKYTWIDLDTFYQNVVLNKAQEHYFTNLKKMAIWFLVNKFGLLEKADAVKIAYYTNEQLNLNLVDVDVFIKCLEKLKGYWANELLRNAALQKYDDAKVFSTKAFGETYWYGASIRFEPLRTFAASLPDR